MKTLEWDNDYPNDLEFSLPPEDAKDINKKLYRIVSKETPDLDDFLASYKDPNQKKHIKRKNRPEFYATSFFSDYDRADSNFKRFPSMFRGKFIAAGDVTSQHGKGKETVNKGHVSMWLYKGVYPKGFKRV